MNGLEEEAHTCEDQGILVWCMPEQAPAYEAPQHVERPWYVEVGCAHRNNQLKQWRRWPQEHWHSKFVLAQARCATAPI